MTTQKAYVSCLFSILRAKVTKVIRQHPSRKGDCWNRAWYAYARPTLPESARDDRRLQRKQPRSAYIAQAISSEEEIEEDDGEKEECDFDPPRRASKRMRMDFVELAHRSAKKSNTTKAGGIATVTPSSSLRTPIPSTLRTTPAIHSADEIEAAISWVISPDFPTDVTAKIESWKTFQKIGMS